MNTPASATPLRSFRNGRLIAVLALCAFTGCQSPNVFTAKNDSPPSKTVEPVPSTVQPAGLPTPTNVESADMALSHTTVDEHLRSGELELEQGNFAQAQIHFDHVLQRHPEHVKANHRLGVLADNLGQYEQAVTHYRTALQGDPRNAALLSDLGYSYWLQGRYPESERYLLEARRYDPHYHKAVANLGLLYGSTGRREEALAMLAQIGDVAEVQQIMKQIAAGEFQSPQQSLEQFTPQQQTSVVTTQSTAQHAVQVPSQDMNEATREFVEQMQLAREELRRTEEQLARQQTQNAPVSSPVTPSQAVPLRNGASPIERAQPSNWTGHTAQHRQVPDPRLAEQVAAIDRRGQPSLTSGPIIVSARESSAGVAHSQSGFQAGFPVAHEGTPFGEPVSLQPPQATQAPNQHQVATSTTAATAPQYWPSPGNHQPLDQSGRIENSHPGQLQPVGNTLARDAAHASTMSRQLAGSPQGPGAYSSRDLHSSQSIQQSSATNAPSPQRPIEHAYHTQQPGRSSDVALAGQVTAGVNSLVPPSLSGHQPEETQQPNALPQALNRLQPTPESSYEQARREAALMGLGAGPGQMFPYIEQTPRSMPGTDSRLNGAQYPAPVRHMPTGLIPPNVHQSYSSSAPTILTPVNNSLGQRMPAIPTQTTVPAASTASHQPYQQADHGSGRELSPTTPYQAARVQQSAQLNGLVNQTWGQSPQSPPYGVAPTSSINSYATPTTGPASVAPRAVIQASESSRPVQSLQQQNGSAGVVPEPYHSHPSGADPVQAPSQQTWADPRNTAPTRPYEGPMIVPSRR